MEKPKITINGKEIEMVEVKARMWREIMEFEEKRGKLNSPTAIDEYCGIIATAFDVTVDEVLDNLNLNDVIPKYFAVLDEVISMLTEKVGKKNVEAAE